MSKKGRNHAIKLCAESFTAATTSSGVERLRLINRAFPWSVHAGFPSLRISWNEKFHLFNVCDYAGFITLVEFEELPSMIKMETRRQGAVRAWIEDRPLKKTQVPKIPPSNKLELESLDLDLTHLEEEN